MKTAEKVLAILALLIITTQTVRHGYLLWLEPRTSVLDRYDEPTKSGISKATSLDELLRQYEPLRKQVDTAKQQSTESVGKFEYSDTEPFKSERMLREAIRDWEAKSREIRALRFYWFIGLGFCLLGMFMYLKMNRWFGLTMVIVAFSEFIYWTSPTFFGGNLREFDRLLLNKFLFSALTLGILIVVIRSFRVFGESRPAAMTAKLGQ